MSGFLSELITLDDEDGSTVRLVGPLHYRSDVLQHDVYVPAAFKTDYASVPQLFQSLIPKFGKQNRAAIVHDWLYQTNGVTRAQADGVFNEAMQVCHVSTWQRRAMYLAVRLGGWKPWNTYRKADHVEETTR